jgi:hypothetical protein
MLFLLAQRSLPGASEFRRFVVDVVQATLGNDAAQSFISLLAAMPQIEEVHLPKWNPPSQSQKPAPPSDLSRTSPLPTAPAHPTKGSEKIITLTPASLRPFGSKCRGQVFLTTPRMPDDWNRAVQNAARSWSEVGTSLKISRLTAFRAMTNYQERFVVRDYSGRDLTELGKFSECQIKAVRSSDFSSRVQTSFPDWKSAAGWTLQYPDPEDDRYALLGVVVLNNKVAAFSLEPKALKVHVETIALHELGHTVGLIHTETKLPGQSVMSVPGLGLDHLDYMAQLSGVPYRKPGSVDIAVLRALYGGR